MWTFTPIGFFSVVAHRDKPHTVLVRSRSKADLLAFKKRYCKRLGKIKFISWADYPYRAEVGRRAYANAMRRVAMDITYDNFKSAVRDNKRHNVYMRVWGVMRDAERKGDMGDKKAANRDKTRHHRGYGSQGSLFGNWQYGNWKGNGKGKKAKAVSSPMPQPRDDHGRFARKGVAVPDILDERDEQMARDADLLPDVDEELFSDPFGWDDGMGGRSDRETEPAPADDQFDDLCDPDDCENDPVGYDPFGEPDEDDAPKGPVIAHDESATLEFDSLDAVIAHFRGKD